MDHFKYRSRGILNSWGDLVVWGMALLFVVAAGIGVVLATAPRAHGQTVYPTAAGQNVKVAGVVPLQCAGNGANCGPVTSANPQPVTVVSGGGGTDGVAQGSTTAGQSGVLTQGAVQTSAPSYTSGQTSPLSLTTGGALRVDPGVAQGSTSAGQSGVLTQGAVTTNPPSYTTAQTSALSLGTNGALRVDTTGALGLTTVQTGAVAANLVVCGSACTLFGFNVTTGASAGYVLVFNATAAPSDGAVTPVWCMPVAANAGIDINWRGAPRRMSTGAAISFSTTGCFSKTASVTAFIAADAR